MTSTVATMATEVENRLNLTHAASSAEPSIALISDYIRLAFKDLIGTLQPPLHTTLTVGAGNTVSFTHDRLFFVSADGLPLFEWEFSSSGANVVVLEAAAEQGDTLQVWYHLAPTITTGSTTTIDTTCVLGDEWLEELALRRACMMACERMAGIAATASNMDYGVEFRKIKEDADALYAQHKMAWDQWYQQLLQGRQSRAVNGPEPKSFSPHAGFINKSNKRNWLTGAGDAGVP